MSTLNAESQTLANDIQTLNAESQTLADEISTLNAELSILTHEQISEIKIEESLSQLK